MFSEFGIHFLVCKAQAVLGSVELSVIAHDAEKLVSYIHTYIHTYIYT
jgi:hypothetical protein